MAAEMPCTYFMSLLIVVCDKYTKREVLCRNIARAPGLASSPLSSVLLHEFVKTITLRYSELTLIDENQSRL